MAWSQAKTLLSLFWVGILPSTTQKNRYKRYWVAALVNLVPISPHFTPNWVPILLYLYFVPHSSRSSWLNYIQIWFDDNSACSSANWHICWWKNFQQGWPRPANRATGKVWENKPGEIPWNFCCYLILPNAWKQNLTLLWQESWEWDRFEAGGLQQIGHQLLKQQQGGKGRGQSASSGWRRF